MKKTEKTGKKRDRETEQITIRLPREWLEEAARLAERIAPPGAAFGRTDGVRAALGKGLEWYRAEDGRRG